MSINIEYIGGALICEHYHEQIGEKHHCRLESISNTIFGIVFKTTHVIWELIATQLDDDRHRFTNNVWVHTTPKFDQYLDLLRIPYETAHQQYQAAVDTHNQEETPGFAAAILRRALQRQVEAAAAQRRSLKELTSKSRNGSLRWSYLPLQTFGSGQWMQHRAVSPYQAQTSVREFVTPSSAWMD